MMTYRARGGLLLAVLASLTPVLNGGAADPFGGRRSKRTVLDRLPAQTKTKTINANNLSLEVTALRSLRTWQATPAQMKALLGLLKEDFVKKTQREPAKASAKLVKNMRLLRQALIQDEEDDIKTYSERVDILFDEDEELDDAVEVTPEAALPARTALRLFTPRQVMAYLRSLEDDLPDPASVLVEALVDGVNVSPERWKKVREDAVARVVWLLLGLAPKESAKLADDARKWLDAHHKMKSEELNKQRSKLEEEVNKELTSRVMPTTILTNVAWHGMAELLCNPRLRIVLEERLKAVAAPTK
jgi:hypothetical protein